jgi:DNA-binding NarL/FixJ family response regulator
MAWRDAVGLGMLPANQLKPDIVLLDIKMPKMDGLEAAHEIQRIAPSTKIVFFTVYDSPQLVSAMRVFSSDFVPKSAAGTKLIPILNRLTGISGDNPTDRTGKSRSTTA